ncbi:MAG TPA: thioredoxin domain-containing protein [Rhizomicrobium sp.]|nr:thioredoxin domain-containing protein [Rhizomicrobium sp.]
MSRNQLDQSNSPYLLLHKDNPVHWYPWGREALEAAEAQNKPILLSIGYTACHWCHVMNAESFADAETAALMNDGYINIKVDRDERPDLDQLYQSAANAMGSTGGWPLTIFLTPAGVPFYAATYLPKEERFGQPSFKSILNDVAKIYTDKADIVGQTTTQLTEQLNNLWNRDMRGPLQAAVLDQIAIAVGQKFDIFYGGIVAPQKFPQIHLVELLWRAHLRTGLPQFLQVASKTLDSILVAGLYDHVGGGFFRYTTDERWLIPHFEKVTSENALILDFVTLVFQHNRNALCQNRMEETVDWLLRDMRVEDGFAASIDADSEGEEGKYYVWSEAEVDAALVGTFSQKFKSAFGITREGNFQGKNILRRIGTAAPYPQSEADESLLQKQCGMLLAARQKRVAPMRDDQVLADTNGMVIAALANAGAAMRRPEWVAEATKAFDFVLKVLGDGDKLYHSWRAGKRGHAGFADDYAHMARGALALWEATGEKRFLAQAQRWVHTLNENFWDAFGGGYFTSAGSDEPLFVRVRSIFDQTQPPANSVMLGVLSRLGMATADTAYVDRCNKLIEGFAQEVTRAYLSAGSFLNGLEFAVSNLQIVVFGTVDNQKTLELINAVLGRSLPNKLLIVVPSGDALPEGHPAKTLQLVNGNPTAYIVQRGQISQAINNPVALSQILQLPQQKPTTGQRLQ